jgi:predicted Na+-dependent transporter
MLRRFIEDHFGIVLIISCFLGLFTPGLNRLPNQSVVIALALLMFVSCYKLQEGGLRTIRWRKIFIFYVLRYILLPIALWFLAHEIIPYYAMGIFLLSMVPAGVASPAFANIYGGSVAPAFAIVILSQLLTPFLIPLQFAWMGGVMVSPSPLALFITMVWCIFLPTLIFLFVKRHSPTASYIYSQNKLFSVLLVAFVIAMALAKQRDVILGNLPGLAVPLIITFACFSIYITFGWFIFPNLPRSQRITFGVCSSFNNAALGVSLALLHFPAPVILFVAISEIAWALLPMMFKVWLRYL